ncbi:hypothetical protein [Nonomuraea basaltis]|uniref:hypothetical protein n=1 Tax=Nonomuraea basaltis TaxID=2495887 RepID=UPI001486CB69|nr:hypothetical protein [Nonomuraea basaltis]
MAIVMTSQRPIWTSRRALVRAVVVILLLGIALGAVAWLGLAMLWDAVFGEGPVFLPS